MANVAYDASGDVLHIVAGPLLQRRTQHWILTKRLDVEVDVMILSSIEVWPWDDQNSSNVA